MLIIMSKEFKHTIKYRYLRLLCVNRGYLVTDSDSVIRYFNEPNHEKRRFFTCESDARGFHNELIIKYKRQGYCVNSRNP